MLKPAPRNYFPLIYAFFNGYQLLTVLSRSVSKVTQKSQQVRERTSTSDIYFLLQGSFNFPFQANQTWCKCMVIWGSHFPLTKTCKGCFGLVISSWPLVLIHVSFPPEPLKNCHLWNHQDFRQSELEFALRWARALAAFQTCCPCRVQVLPQMSQQNEGIDPPKTDRKSFWKLQVLESPWLKWT